MTSLVQNRSDDSSDVLTDLGNYLKAAAKIVETVAFEMADHVSAEAVAELLELARGIETAAGRIKL
ncbi:hypothetical protein OS189_11890 [Sulfitobacter sp. F26169L]|uniref:hypothetical protein n=1 Tax=Sulfitobacter sp. F26169L TaxID=2996015 RepID=UPI002260D3A5|nr:hypothetical protein [Sulfitobacter sp. F26169L]MCX7567043.1 hypothetical protein [Sulfitobacter sp. F26169L]